MVSQARNSPSFDSRAPRGQVPDIYSTLRDRICLLGYPPGTVLGENQLAGEFAVSRTPVRQALQRLEYDGLIETRNGVGTIVTGVEHLAFQEIYAFRLRLSEMIGEFAALDEVPAALASVKHLLELVRSFKGGQNIAAFWRLCHDLHHATNRLIANKALRDTHARYYFQASRIWYGVIDAFFPEQVEDFRDELEEIMRALAVGDVRAVGYIQRNHIAYGLQRVAQALSFAAFL